MQKLYLLFSLVCALLLCGCGKQEKINSQKIDALSQRISQLEQIQTNQVAVVRSQLDSLAPTLDKINNSYFEKNRDDALFFHTNTLFLLLTIGKQIETQLQTADSERQAQNSLAYACYSNQLSAMYLCTAQIEDAMTNQETRIEDNINAGIERADVTLSDNLSKQIKSLLPDAAEIARRRKMETDVAQIQNELDAIKSRLGITNQP